MSEPLTLGFVLAASDHGPLIVSRFDFNSAPGGGIYGVGAQVLGCGRYEPSEVALILEQLTLLRQQRGDGVVALDCGANIGVMSIEMARHMRGWGQIRAFEAQERLFYALCGNIALANLYNVNASFCALGAECGMIGVPVPNYNKSGSFGSLEIRHHSRVENIGQSINYSPHRLVETPLVSIDSLGLKRVDFLKLDVEGMELDVLEGAKDAIKTFRPVILIEWLKIGTNKVENWFVSNEYEFEKIGMNYLGHSLTEKH